MRTKQIIFFLLTGLFIFGIIKTTFIWHFKNSNDTMSPNYPPGSKMWVNLAAYQIKVPFTEFQLLKIDEPKISDVIVFQYANDKNAIFVKRIVAVAGDTVFLNGKQLYVNQAPVNQAPVPNGSEIIQRMTKYFDDATPTDSYELFEESHSKNYHILHIKNKPAADFSIITIPANEVFVLGDNRDRSIDSRNYGSIPIKHIIGRVID